MIAEIVKNKKGKKAVLKDVTAESKIAEQKAVGIGDVRKLKRQVQLYWWLYG